MSPLSPEQITDTTEEVASIETSGMPPEKKEKHPVAEIFQFALLALLIVIPIRFFIAQPFIVSGASMEDTFHTNEYLIVDQVSYYFNEPERGDIIIFRYPRDPSKYFIKRIIGLPGETLDISGNVVTITNEETEESFILDESYIKSMQENTYLTEKLGEREYFVMGDNRDASSDSRVWGVLQEESIVGRALIRLFPFDEVGLFPGKIDIDADNLISTNQ